MIIKIRKSFDSSVTRPPTHRLYRNSQQTDVISLVEPVILMEVCLVYKHVQVRQRCSRILVCLYHQACLTAGI